MAQHELLLFSAVFLLIGALDDICVDVIWAVRRLYRRLIFYRTIPPLTAHQLPAPDDPGWLAVFIPAWAEAAVIGAMLENCAHRWRDSKNTYRIYVGCYPNDPQTADAVVNAARSDRNIRLVLVDHDGPTTKADCLSV